MELQENPYFQTRFTKVRFTLEMIESCRMTGDKESALRGGIGEMLLRQYCIRDRMCEHCSFETACIVQNFMYAKYRIKPEFHTKGESIGFVIEADRGKRNYVSGETMSFSITLFGDTIVYINPIIQAIHMLGQVGIGTENARFQIKEIRNRRGQQILENGNFYYERYLVETLADYVKERKEELRTPKQLLFIRPLTIKYRSEFLTEFHMQAILNSVSRRLYMLACYEGNEAEELRFYEEIPVILSQQVEHQQVTRYSNRKQQKITMKGISGAIEVDGIREEILEFLLAGELTYIGKNTKFGFGKYRVS